jgi:hypothetical protein
MENKKTNNKDQYYLNKDDLWKEIDLYYKRDDVNRADGGDGCDLGNDLGTMIMNIAENIMSAQNFSGYPFKSEMVGDAELRMVSVIASKKFKLWSQAQVPVLLTVSYRGWEETPKMEEYRRDNPEYVYTQYNTTGLESITVMKPIDDSFYIDDDGNQQIAYEKLKVERGMFKKVSKGMVSLHYHDEEPVMKRNKIVFVNRGMVNSKGDEQMVKNNAFGYLSLISTREAITRLKKEKKNYTAIYDYQEQEFLKFLSENPEMAPQKVDDDSYEI